MMQVPVIVVVIVVVAIMELQHFYICFLLNRVKTEITNCRYSIRQ